MKIGDVFAFNIDDEFHYQVSPYTEPPAVDRITIINKYFNELDDTVYYERFHDSYWTEVEWYPEPHLIYHFYTYYDTVYYTNLDSLISTYDLNFICQEWWDYCLIETYFSEEFCDRLINSYYIETSEFEGEVLEKKYGKGLGWVSDYLYTYDIYPHLVRDMKMFYYKKNGIDCGTPDTLTVSTPELETNENKFTVSPNPVKDYFTVHINSINTPIIFKIFDIYGNAIETGEWLLEENIHNCTGYLPGLYIIQISNKRNVFSNKIVKI